MLLIVDIEKDKYIIRDSDDGIDTAVTYNELLKIRDLGLNVEGMDRAIKHRKFVANIAKLSMLYGVVANINGLQLTDLTIRNLNTPCTIKLSSICERVGNYCMTFISSFKEVVIEFDDNIDFKRGFINKVVNFTNITFDITNLTDTTKAEEFYSAAVNFRLASHIIDNDIERMTKWQAVYIMNSNGHLLFPEHDLDYKKYDRFIYDQYKDDFEKFANKKIKITHMIKDLGEFCNSSQNYTKQQRLTNFCHCLYSACDNIEFYEILRLISYILYFGNEKRVEEIYNNLEKRFIETYRYKTSRNQ